MRWNKSSLTASTIAPPFNTGSTLFGCLVATRYDAKPTQRVGAHPPTPPLPPPVLTSYLALMRYWAILMLAGGPVIVTWRAAEPSVALAILM